MTTRKHAASTRRKISLAQKGRKNSMYGRHQSGPARRRISAATRGRKNPMFGRSHSAETRQLISRIMRQKAALKRKSRGKPA